VILADTSVWVEHLRKRGSVLAGFLDRGEVSTHSFVIGELALGNLRQRTQLLSLLVDLPRVSLASDDEVLAFIERHRLAGAGIGYVDAHLLAGAALTPDTRLLTLDRHLAAVAERLDLSARLR
jgi:predicted nucleic acid-binding protein